MNQNAVKPFAFALAVAATFALPRANAQQSVEEFLKPYIKMQAPIDNYGPPTGSKENPAFPYRRVCTISADGKTISCRTFIPKLPSGGGKWFGPWYWVAPDPSPAGYRFQSASFNLPMLDQNGKRVNAPDYCYGNDNSPQAACDPRGCGVVSPGNPDTSWMGHKYGAEHSWAVCYIQRQDANGPKWLYNLQGQEGGVSVITWPFAGDNNLFKIEQRRDGAVSEPAELDVVYVKVQPPTPQAHKVVKGENLTMIAKAIYGNENWQKIYEANKGKIKGKIEDADAIFPGQELTIPNP